MWTNIAVSILREEKRYFFCSLTHLLYRENTVRIQGIWYLRLYNKTFRFQMQLIGHFNISLYSARSKMHSSFIFESCEKPKRFLKFESAPRLAQSAPQNISPKQDLRFKILICVWDVVGTTTKNMGPAKTWLSQIYRFFFRLPKPEMWTTCARVRAHLRARAHGGCRAG